MPRGHASPTVNVVVRKLLRKIAHQRDKSLWNQKTKARALERTTKRYGVTYGAKHAAAVDYVPPYREETYYGLSNADRVAISMPYAPPPPPYRGVHHALRRGFNIEPPSPVAAIPHAPPLRSILPEEDRDTLIATNYNSDWGFPEHELPYDDVATAMLEMRDNFVHMRAYTALTTQQSDYGSYLCTKAQDIADIMSRYTESTDQQKISVNPNEVSLLSHEVRAFLTGIRAKYEPREYRMDADGTDVAAAEISAAANEVAAHPDLVEETAQLDSASRVTELADHPLDVPATQSPEDFQPQPRLPIPLNVAAGPTPSGDVGPVSAARASLSSAAAGVPEEPVSLRLRSNDASKIPVPRPRSNSDSSLGIPAPRPRSNSNSSLDTEVSTGGTRRPRTPTGISVGVGPNRAASGIAMPKGDTAAVSTRTRSATGKGLWDAPETALPYNTFAAGQMADAQYAQNTNRLATQNIMAALAALQVPDAAYAGAHMTGNSLRDLLQPTSEQDNMLYRMLTFGNTYDRACVMNAGVESSAATMHRLAAMAQQQEENAQSTQTGAIMLPHFGNARRGDGTVATMGMTRDARLTQQGRERLAALHASGAIDNGAYSSGDNVVRNMQKRLDASAATTNSYRQATQAVQAAAARREMAMTLTGASNVIAVPSRDFSTVRPDRMAELVKIQHDGVLRTNAATEAQRYLMEVSAANSALLGDQPASSFVTEARQRMDVIKQSLQRGVELAPRAAVAASENLIAPTVWDRAIADSQTRVRTFHGSGDMRTPFHQLSRFGS